MHYIYEIDNLSISNVLLLFETRTKTFNCSPVNPWTILSFCYISYAIC